MSMNQFSSADTLWWTQQQQHRTDPNPHTFASSNPNQQNPHTQLWLTSQQSANFNLNDHRHSQNDREAMFEKPLTPSDVGKLNRLVIPKQHAERYFPLAGDKGLLLAFEDEAGKPWRFRYSYWNSSQSYVLTKGWSRYVKENQLDAGDVVLFHRHTTDSHRFFIGWRRRDGTVAAGDPAPNPPPPHHPVAIPYHAGRGGSNVAEATVPAANLKRLRLFGVNLECATDEWSEPSTPDGSSSVSSQGAPQYHHYQQQQHYYYASQANSPPNHHTNNYR